MKIDAELSGDWSQYLDKLTDAAGESALREVAFSGADIFRDEAQARAPVRSGVLKANIIVVRATEESDGDKRQVYKVRVRTGKKNVEGDAFYWKWVEFGKSNTPARPFMRPAFETKQVEVVQTMTAQMLRRIEGVL